MKAVRNALKKVLLDYEVGLTEKIAEHTEQSGIPEETKLTHLLWMSTTALENVEIWPVDKVSRWLGYIQGVLTCRGVITVSEERDRTRVIFHQAYREDGILIPESLR